MKINPIRLPGDWKAGFALDLHTASSEYLGDDEYGRAKYDTKRSEVGELLFRLKYRSDRTVVEALGQAAAEFVKSQEWPVELIVPVPPSRAARAFQPLPLLAKATGRFLEIPVRLDCVAKVKVTPELKSVYDFDERLHLLQDAYTVAVADVTGRRVLLLDDLYRSGATLKAVAGSLMKDGGVTEMYVLAFSKTRRRR